jgi:hypothetical protein
MHERLQDYPQGVYEHVALFPAIPAMHSVALS